jgi:integration host factor subunit beta
MTKTGLITHVARRLPYMTRQDAQIIVDTIFDSMADALAQGEGIEIRGFGSLKVRKRGEREGRNPRTGESVHIQAKKSPLFRIGKELHERINQTVPSAGSMSMHREQDNGRHENSNLSIGRNPACRVRRDKAT